MKALVVGGSNGIGLSIVLNLVAREDVEIVYVMDKVQFPKEYPFSSKVSEIICDLSQLGCLESLKKVSDVQMLFITAGFGHLKLFQDLSPQYIQTIFSVNAIAPIEIIRHFYDQLMGKEPFFCAVMVSIAGRLNSPFFSVYSATKAALSKCFEAINVELEEQGSPNRILEVSPGSLKGTGFSGGVSNPEMTMDLACEIIARSERHEILYIPQYDEVFKAVIGRYQADAQRFGKESYHYKLQRINSM